MRTHDLHILMFAILVMSFAAGCGTLGVGGSGNSSNQMDPEVRAKHREEVQAAQALLEKKEFSKSAELFEKFVRRHSGSMYFQSAKLGLAQSYEGLEKWAEAARLYSEVAQSTITTQPEMAATALYLSSFCYEAMGDEARLLSSLMDAFGLRRHLRAEQSAAELPVRIAAAMSRMGRFEDAQEYLKIADKGVALLRLNDSERSPELRSKIYYQMGYFSNRQLSFENLQTSLDAFRMVQSYSLKSLELAVDPWSVIAAENLRSNYLAFWNLVQQIPLNTSLDTGAALRDRFDRQIQFVGDLLKAKNELLTKRRAIDKDQSLNPIENDFYAFLSALGQKAENFLASTNPETPLTKESQKFRSLKREGTIANGGGASVPNQADRVTTPLPAKSMDDPNLAGGGAPFRQQDTSTTTTSPSLEKR